MTYNPKERFELYKQSVAQGLRWADVSSGKVQVQKFQEGGPVKEDGLNIGAEISPEIGLGKFCGSLTGCGKGASPFSIRPSVEASYNIGSKNINTRYGGGIGAYIGSSGLESNLSYKRRNAFDTQGDDAVTPIGKGTDNLSLDLGIGGGGKGMRSVSDSTPYRYGINTEYDLTNKKLSNIGLYGQYGKFKSSLGYSPTTKSVNVGAGFKFQEEGEVKDNKTEFASQSVGDTTETLISNLSEKLDWTEGRKKYETQKSSKRIQNFLQTDFGKNAVASLSKEDMAALLQKVEGLASPIIDVADKGDIAQYKKMLKSDLSFLKPYREKMGYVSKGGFRGEHKAKKRFIRDILSYEEILNLKPIAKEFSGAIALKDFKGGGSVKKYGITGEVEKEEEPKIGGSTFRYT